LNGRQRHAVRINAGDRGIAATQAEGRVKILRHGSHVPPIIHGFEIPRRDG